MLQGFVHKTLAQRSQRRVLSSQFLTKLHDLFLQLSLTSKCLIDPCLVVHTIVFHFHHHFTLLFNLFLLILNLRLVALDFSRLGLILDGLDLHGLVIVLFCLLREGYLLGQLARQAFVMGQLFLLELLLFLLFFLCGDHLLEELI